MKYALLNFIFFGLPLGMAVFLCWRAYQLGILGRMELARQWLLIQAPGIEKFAKLFAVRDLISAFGCFLFVALLLLFPVYIKAWSSLLSTFAFAHQSITYYAAYKASKK